MKSQKKYYSMLIGIMIVVICITVAYAAISNNIVVMNNKEKAKNKVWDAGFDTTISTISASSGGTATSSKSCGTALISKDRVEITDISLTNPGDSCTWPLNLTNTGNVASVIKETMGTPPSGVTCTTNTTGKMICGRIIYILTTDIAGKNIIKEKMELKEKGTQAVYLKAYYDGSYLNSETVTQKNAMFTVLFEHKK